MTDIMSSPLFSVFILASVFERFLQRLGLRDGAVSRAAMRWVAVIVLFFVVGWSLFWVRDGLGLRPDA